MDEKTCGFCRTDEENHCSVIQFDGEDGETVSVQMPYGMIEIIFNRNNKNVFHLDFDINFCPMCGRKLEEN